EALLALQDEPRSATIESGLDLIQKNLDDAHSSLALSLSALALQAYGRDYSEKIRSLASNQHADGSFGINVMVSAVST
ncbi:hypothetical protein ACQUFE_18640, partial [Enterococcus casseliflavus]|uniref:hypothetical protein n=1 Tax=Enterococcus casseliflavus TaxID=37734 RepID=UPI003D0D3E8F